MHRTSVRRGAGLAVLATAALAIGGCKADKIKTTGATVVDPTTTSTVDLTASTEPGVSTSLTARRSPTTGGTTATTARPGAPGPASGSGSVVLNGTSFGPARIGDTAETAVAAVTKALGQPTKDKANPGQECIGPERIVVWGRFTIAISSGQVIGWIYEDSPSGPPSLSTGAGITTGSTVAAVKKAYGTKATVHQADGSFPAYFMVDQGAGGKLYGFLSSSADAGKVTTLYSGATCGE